METNKVKEINLLEINMLALAYLGDSIWETVVREHFILTGHKVNELNKLSIQFVNAKSQSKFYKKLVGQTDEKYDIELEQKYFDIGRRAKNTKIKNFPRTCTTMEYKEATAFEAVVGALYVDGKTEIVKKIFKNSLFMVK